MKRDRLSAARKLQVQVEDQWASRRSRKDGVLHLRIEASIVERVKLEAQAHDLSVSDYVRMRLVEGFGVSSDTPQRPDFLLDTFAWTDAVILQDRTCAICATTLPRGTQAWLAAGPPPPVRFICEACYKNVLSESQEVVLQSEEINSER